MAVPESENCVLCAKVVTEDDFYEWRGMELVYVCDECRLCKCCNRQLKTLHCGKYKCWNFICETCDAPCVKCKRLYCQKHINVGMERFRTLSHTFSSWIKCACHFCDDCKVQCKDCSETSCPKHLEEMHYCTTKNCQDYVCEKHWAFDNICLKCEDTKWAQKKATAHPIQSHLDKPNS